MTGRRIINTAPRPTAEERKRLDLVFNEQTKLLANWLNGIAVAIFAVGALAPSVTLVTSDNAHANLAMLVLVGLSVNASMLAHKAAQQVLRRLQ